MPDPVHGDEPFTARDPTVGEPEHRPPVPRQRVPQSWLRRNRRGVWYVKDDIPFDRVRRIVTFAEVARAVA
jgi:hypothetical protein